MKIEATCSNPDDVEFSITMTASLSDWITLKKSLYSNSGTQLKNELFSQISCLVTQFAGASYMPKTEETDDAKTD